MLLIFPLIGSNGASDLPSSIASAVPLAHQWGGLIPLPMNITAKRLGNAAVAPASAADAEPISRSASDSSQGKAIVTPTPRRNVLRRTPPAPGRFACLSELVMV